MTELLLGLVVLGLVGQAAVGVLVVRALRRPPPQLPEIPAPIIHLPEGETVDLGPVVERMARLEGRIQGLRDHLSEHRAPPCRFDADALAGRVSALFENPADEGEPTALAVLKHDHRYGPKDGDGIRHCRCGDRYLDGMRVE